jgi:hypothetical protein
VGGERTDPDYIGIDGNISLNPMFVAVPPAILDEHLQPASPVIDVGDNAEAPVAVDFDDNPRIQDGNNDTNAVIDIGAYEFSDLDGDGLPDWADPDDDNDGVPDETDCLPRVRGVGGPPPPIGNTLKITRSAGQGV